jgi:RecA/RadA recombinase
MVNKIMANAQKKGMHVVYFDTENALDKDTAENLGCDSSKIKHCPIEIIEDCRNQMVKFLKTVVEKGLQGKVIIAIDSLGNLISTREAKVIEDGKDGSKSRFFKKYAQSNYTCCCKGKYANRFYKSHV